MAQADTVTQTNGPGPFFCLQLGPDRRVVDCDKAARALFGDCQGAPSPVPCPEPGTPRDWPAEGIVWRLWAEADPDGGRTVRGLAVTDLAVAAALAATRQDQLAAILNGAREGVVIAVAGRLVFVNPFMERLTGHDAATLLSRPFTDFLHPEDRKTVLATHTRRLAGQAAPESYNFRLVTASGGIRHVSASSGRIEWEGKPAAVSFLGDISAQKAAQSALAELVSDQETVIAGRTSVLRETNERLTAEIAEHERTAAKLKAARLKLAKALRAKSVFLANVSHEIRTPLNVVLGMADMALRPDSTGQVDQIRALQMIHEAGSSLRGILGDLLDLSRVESGRLEMESLPFSPAKVLRTVLDRYKAVAERQGISLAGETALDVPLSLLGDAGRLDQVLGNLVGNALKFTADGSVTVSLTLARPNRRALPGAVALRFAVRDTGIGIAPDKQKTIFDSFSQADETIGRRFGGTGLGLAICRRLVGLMGGRLRLTSVPGQGSEFYFTARFRSLLESQPVRPTARSRALEPLDILLAEDSDLSAEMIQAFLTPKGHTVVRVVNGEEALVTLGLRRFDAVLMDIQMPVMDGLAATRAIRAGAVPGVSPDIPIVALTAYGGGRDRDRILGCGVTDYLTKPVNFDRLLEVLSGCLGLAPTACLPPEGPRPAVAVVQPTVGLDEPAFDAGRSEALGNLGDDQELYDRLVAVFLRDTPADRGSLEAALAAGDTARVALVAHSLKGNAGIVGATPAGERARAVELAARAGQTAALPGLIAALVTVLEATLAGFAAKGYGPAGP
ncbi:ATP-binding protein [Desulfovibrio sp. TomC]|uniref:ATP-binding protein n=1 Tax=Desulfovibrio sp. TomC TaxID=1562888 RepID=UPI0005751140|nr:ATP-binding protein [Desulfovibrio sp. TomC]KHK02622.1 sensory box histidine kinase/response regulator [Desulfovibrio sp. TomC]